MSYNYRLRAVLSISTGHTRARINAMHLRKTVLRNFVLASPLLGWGDLANAQCTPPYQLTNGQVADATQVMATQVPTP